MRSRIDNVPSYASPCALGRALDGPAFAGRGLRRRCSRVGSPRSSRRASSLAFVASSARRPNAASVHARTRVDVHAATPSRCAALSSRLTSTLWTGSPARSGARLAAGRVLYTGTIAGGLERAPTAFVAMLPIETTRTALVRLASAPYFTDGSKLSSNTTSSRLVTKAPPKNGWIRGRISVSAAPDS
jgi:hypothetical protein